MKTAHVTFAQLSDLYDGILSEQEEKLVADHLESCLECQKEFEMLKKTLCCLAPLRETAFCTEEFSPRTMKLVKKRASRSASGRFVPAAAAAAFIIGGYTFFFSGPANNYGTDSTDFVIAGSTGNNRFENAVSRTGSKNVKNTTRDVINAIADNKARIVRISDSFIEGEVSLSEFLNLKSQLGARHIDFAQISESSDADRIRWNSGIEEVSLSNVTWQDEEARGPEKDLIRFRVFK